ncbi:MAG: hypothetical protein R3337_00315 [Gammaproteobacteria bacterium]|nr:hypothetical protein [Gammaproteobacteria bacterium]
MSSINARAGFDKLSLDDMRAEYREAISAGREASWATLLAEACELDNITEEQRDHWAHASPTGNAIKDRSKGPMKLTDEGLVINKNALEALLAFASADPKRPNLYGVHFIASDTHVKARATNGHIALDAVGENESARPNEWFVHREFLKGAQKVLDNKSTLTLQFSGASLRDAVVHNEDGVEMASFSWPNDAANFQTSFPEPGVWDDLLKPPGGKKTSRVRLNADYLGLMGKVSKAAGVHGIDCYPPPAKDERVVFRCEGQDTTWIAVVMPMNSEDDEEPSGAAAAVQNLKGAAERTGTTVTMTTMDGEEVHLAGPKNEGEKSKKTRKGRAKK